MDVFDLQAKISLDDSAYTKGLSSAGGALKDFASLSFKAIGEVASGFVDLSKMVGASVSELATFGDHIDKQSQKMNMSAEAYQEWDAIMQHSGTTIDSMQASMKTLSNAVETGNDAFEKLGISQEELQSLNSEQLFERTITALQNMGDDTERTYLAGQLLGRGATELGALLNTSAEDTEKMRQRVHELGGVMGDDAVKASAAFQDSLQDMQTAISGVKRSVVSELIPSFTEVMDGITEVFAGESGGENKIEKGINQAFEGIGKSAAKLKPIVSRLGNSLFTVIQSNLPQIVSNGIQFTTNIATEIISALPQILSNAGGILETIGGTISTNIPKLADAARQAITGFSGYLRENLPTIIPEGVGAVGEFVKGLTSPETTGTLINAASDIINGLINGLTSEKTLNQIVTDAPIIVDNIVTGITNGVDKLADAALTLTGNLLSYLSNPENRQKLEDCAEKILDSIAQGFTKLLGTGAEAVYNFGGQIAENIGLGEYWQVGNDALGDFWEGFQSLWTEFKKWFNIEWKDLLNPISAMKSVTESVSGRVVDLADGEDSTLLLENPGKVEVPDFTGPTLTGVPDKFRQKHGYHAKGGIFTKPYYASGDWFGESGREALLPLDNNTSWMDKLVDKINGNGGTRNYYITVNAESVNTEADFDILVEKIDNKLAERHVMQNRAVGATGW